MLTEELNKYFFTFAQVHDLEFFSINIGGLIQQDNGLAFTAEIEQNFKVEPEHGRILTRTEVSFLVDQPENPREKAVAVHYVNMTVSKHENIDIIASKGPKGEILIDPMFQEFLSSTVLSTVRGILIEKLSNSPSRALILPLVLDNYKV